MYFAFVMSESLKQFVEIRKTGFFFLFAGDSIKYKDSIKSNWSEVRLQTLEKIMSFVNINLTQFGCNRF